MKNDDKFSKLNLRVEEGVKVNGPLLSDCPVNIECKVVDSIVTGSHEMFVGKVEFVHADEKLLNDKGEIDFSKIEFL